MNVRVFMYVSPNNVRSCTPVRVSRLSAFSVRSVQPR
jgi:hypothetical protein